MSEPTLSQALAEGFQRHNIKRIFGVPGGGSALPIIDAARELGIDFVLTRSEMSASIMAAVTGEISGAPGVVLACLGPGASSLATGTAYASLEQAPMLLLTDGPAVSLHQRYDQNAFFAPITKHQGRFTPEGAVTDIEDVLCLANDAPLGPVQMNINAGGSITAVSAGVAQVTRTAPVTSSESAIDDARKLLANSRKPVLLVGLEARYGDAPQAALRLAEAMNCPVLSTYKGKGVVPDKHARMAGMFTGAVSEFNAIEDADLIVTFGVDPVEFIASPWHHTAPILEIRASDTPHLLVETAARIIGPLTANIDALCSVGTQSEWTAETIAALTTELRERVEVQSNGHTAQSVAEAIVAAAPGRIRASVDAGAHMVSAMSVLEAEHPFGVLKSNGLSTMGYALPAAIASALNDPDMPAVAVTGDGGLMMCMAELSTAKEHNCNVVAVVLNDSALSLIDIKQQWQELETAGVRFPDTDFSAVAKGMGVAAWRVGPSDDLLGAMKEAFAHDGPTLVDVTTDASVYNAQVAALRG
ncbi:MAG: thiamine pyrophosphate-binding protein [Marinosulfonomonas sp.]|nr:thiamine pyrophosphate-binding protein [Marinosulfonomonas sp.]